MPNTPPAARLRPAAAALAALAPFAAAQDPVTLPGFDSSQHVVIPARAPAPKTGHALLVVLPGGNGNIDFLPWVQNGILGAAPDDCIGVMVTAAKWHDGQQTVWPTRARPEPGMRYATEDHVRAVLAAVRKDHAIDDARVAVLCWSSAGPAVYEMLLGEDPPFRRAYVAMSVFHAPRGDKALARAKGLRLLLDQSPDDTVTRFAFAEQARDLLGARGAVVHLVTYRGGHGWQDDPKTRLTNGLRWLFSDEPAPAAAAALEPAQGKNLLQNGSFEQKQRGWDVVDNSSSLTVAFVTDDTKDGKAALHLTKTGKLPLDLVAQDVRLPARATKVTARAWVRCKGAGNAFVKCFLHDAGGEVVHEDVDLVQLRGDAGWQLVEHTWERQDAVRATFQIVLVLGGEVWVDAAEIVVGS